MGAPAAARSGQSELHPLRACVAPALSGLFVRLSDFHALVKLGGFLRRESAAGGELTTGLVVSNRAIERLSEVLDVIQACQRQDCHGRCIRCLSPAIPYVDNSRSR